MLHKYEVEFKEVELEKYGTWGPRAVFVSITSVKFWVWSQIYIMNFYGKW